MINPDDVEDASEISHSIIFFLSKTLDKETKPSVVISGFLSAFCFLYYISIRNKKIEEIQSDLENIEKSLGFFVSKAVKNHMESEAHTDS